jgi:hypothetical protein
MNTGPVSSTNKSDHDITEILLKESLNTTTLIIANYEWKGGTQFLSYYCTLMIDFIVNKYFVLYFNSRLHYFHVSYFGTDTLVCVHFWCQVTSIETHYYTISETDVILTPLEYEGRI